jgi:AraC-like DNA-binding protein
VEQRSASAAGVTVTRFSGERGLQRFRQNSEIELEVEDRGLFEASVTRVDLDSAVGIEEIQVTPVRSASSRSDRSDPSDRVALLVLEEGRYRVTGEREETSVEAGDVILVDTRAVVRLASVEPGRLLLTTTRLEALPPYVRDGPPMPSGTLPRTVLLDGYTAFLRSVRDRWRGDPDQAPHLIHALEDLTVSVLAEARGAPEPTGPAEILRFRVKDLIERRLADPALSAVTIAAALSVSPRYVHHVFRPEGTSVARYIEERRLRAIAVQLRRQPSPARPNDLAARWGFGGPDQLSRAFRRRYGLTLEQYRESSGLRPVPPGRNGAQRGGP